VASSIRILAFVNQHGDNVEEACAALQQADGFDVRRIPPHALADEVRRAVTAGAERVVVAGGDGSIGSAAASLCGSATALAVLPAGTLNHFAKDLGLPDTLTEAAAVARGSHRRTLDVAFVNGHAFLNTSSVGAYVGFVRRRDALERWLGYRVASIVAGLSLLRRLRTFRVTLDLDGKICEYQTPLVFIGVGERELKLPTLGSRVKGGKRGLHVMVLRTRSGARTLALAFAAMARGVNAVAHTPALDAFIVDRLRIEPRRKIKDWHIAIDGEVIRVEPPLEYHLTRDGLSVIVPAPRSEADHAAPLATRTVNA
jgi:diacylglycerol kinase family enzyme